MKRYELCIIFQPDTSDAEMDGLLSGLGDAVAQHKGAVLKTEKWGKRNLKFVLKKQTKGNFCFMYFTGTAETLRDIDRAVRYNEQILRYAIIKLDKNMNLDAQGSATAGAAASFEAVPAEQAEPAETTPGA